MELRRNEAVGKAKESRSEVNLLGLRTARASQQNPRDLCARSAAMFFRLTSREDLLCSWCWTAEFSSLLRAVRMS